MSQRKRTRAEISFHVALATVLAPLMVAPMLEPERGVLLTTIAVTLLALQVIGLFALAVYNTRFASDDPAQRRWTRRLFGLALVDALVAIALLLSGTFGLDTRSEARAPARIGVVLDQGSENGVTVREVYAGSPAERAGLRAGDRIVRAGSHRVRSASELAEHVAHAHDVALTVERRGSRIAVRVTPSANVRPPTVLRSTRCEAPVDASGSSLWDATPYGVFLCLVLALWAVGRRRARQWTFWLPFLGVLFAGAFASSIGAWIGCLLAGGAGMRARTAGLLVGEVGVALVAIVWLAIARRDQPTFADERERWPVPRTYATGLLYSAAWMPRVAAVSIPLIWLSQKLGVGEVSPVLQEVLGHSGADPITAVLTFGAAVILAPVAEEVLFRGLLLPHLGRSFSPWTSIYTGAVLFGLLHVAHGVMLIGPLVLGALFGWARMRSRGLIAPILLHVTVNATAVLTSWSRP